MRKFFFCLALLPGMFQSFAQTNKFDQTGNAGIGTTAPLFPLHIKYNASAATSLIGLTSNYAGTIAETYVGDYGDYGAILSHNRNPDGGTFVNSALSPNQFKAASISVGGYNNPYMFSVANFPGGVANERMVVDWNGNVGIGTKTPGAVFHVVPSANDGGIKFNNQINGYSSIIWNANNVGFGLVSGGGLCAVANDGYGFSIGKFATSTSAGAMLNVKGGGATAATYAVKIQNDNTVDLLSVRNDGNIGIGTANPAGALHVLPATVGDGGIVFGKVLNGYTSITWASNNVGLGLVSGGGLCAVAQPGYGFSIGNFAPQASTGAMLNVSGTGTTSATYSVKIQNSSADNLFAIRDDGNVGIGTVNPQAKLAVNGDIVSKKVRVSPTGWADYVFDAGYKLRSLSEVEKYIQQHQHLPEVPSAGEVSKNGLDVGDNQATLLKKIEELTLYMIEQNKKIEALEKEVKQLKNK